MGSLRSLKHKPRPEKYAAPLEGSPYYPMPECFQTPLGNVCNIDCEYEIECKPEGWAYPDQIKKMGEKREDENGRGEG